MADPTPQPAVVEGLKHMTAVLAQANVAAPVIVSAVIAVVQIVKALRGAAPPLKDLIDDVDRQVEENRLRGAAEVARLKALL